MKPGPCTLCDCGQYGWNGKPDALASDPPATCKCGHACSKHRFVSEHECNGWGLHPYDCGG